MPETLLRAKQITKTFGDTVANQSVDLSIEPGEIHALLGENGAGKSTLVKIIYGALQPDSGSLYWKDEKVVIPNPAAARELGIGMVFQHFSLFDSLTVAENIALALPKAVSLRELSESIESVSESYGLPLRASSRIADLSVGERQRVEIVRCLLQNPSLIIMDEPTSVLTPQEADQLFETLERLAEEKRAILYISHRLEEVERLCQKATILRHGQFISDCDPSQETPASLARMMVGAEIHTISASPYEFEAPVTRFETSSLCLPQDGPFSIELKNISMAVKSGEVFAIAGIAGNGQSELFDALSGEACIDDNNAVKIDGNAVGNSGIETRRRLGGAFVPEERLGHGAIPGLKLSENIVLTRHGNEDDGITRSGFLSRGNAEMISDRVCRLYDVRKGTPDPEARSLSGGNLQKFVVGREIDHAPGVLIVSQPTWGVDAGAAALIRQALLDLARSGSAVIVISQDLDEIFEIADRIAVIHDGLLSEDMTRNDATREKIGLLMGGIESEGGATDAA
ncbi:ABC transporter ATP-binding protein [Coralliovum pocilloporae]|uniref:ABC transporter ATP-binding protein n=1 Tax=Coralliovum pocilloporae TaxID=3066369 RepID=UPI0033078F50